MSFRTEMTRAKAELQALKQALGRTQLAAGMVQIRCVNDPEDFENDAELRAFRDEAWDGCSTIEIDSVWRPPSR
jgi:hypothetical protein